MEIYNLILNDKNIRILICISAVMKPILPAGNTLIHFIGTAVISDLNVYSQKEIR